MTLNFFLPLTKNSDGGRGGGGGPISKKSLHNAYGGKSLKLHNCQFFVSHFFSSFFPSQFVFHHNLHKVLGPTRQPKKKTSQIVQGS